MTDETTTPEAKVETSDAPTQETAPEAATTESAPAVEPASEELSFNDRMSAYGNEDSPDKEAHGKYTADLKGQGYSEAVDSLRPQMETLSQTAKANSELYDRTFQGVQTIGGLIRTALSEGTITEEKMSNILQSNPAAFEAFTAAKTTKDGGELDAAKKTARDEGVGEGTYQGAQFLIEEGIKAIQRPAMIQKYTERLQAARQGQDDATKIAQDYSNDVFQAGYEAGLASTKAETTEADNVAERVTQKPPQGIGSVGGGDDNARLLDPNTPVSELIEIRTRQKAG